MAHEVTCQAKPHIDKRAIGWQYDRRSHLTGLNARCDLDTVNIEVEVSKRNRVDDLLLEEFWRRLLSTTPLARSAASPLI
jgi:hypothetical protein